ncbi:MAG: 1-(5-phosphoribosyl)-5-[(5-phosphoribosylamino)methylideneamino]imidazole-4-carboxamide isomerase [Alphaproteobacteria bacterium]|nr:MAG: 1-(5-phosphoribosyl)-5-[(5-phosphoribosylamino)methylideneamino]imidazole-4-carboxamide isomerase [Alphaproteobacteria bacterium]
MTLTLIPAIDLKDGQVVRLREGAFDRKTVYSHDPVAIARQFAARGAQMLHIVDLDGARAGAAGNREAVQAILETVDLPVQLGGGIRSIEAIAGWLNAGIARVIVSTMAVDAPEAAAEAAQRFPGRVWIGIDARDGEVKVAGWERGSGIRAHDLARLAANWGMGGIVYTDISRDGTGSGINVQAVVAMAEAVPLPVIASGGLRDLADLAALKKAAGECHGQIAGVIAGRSLYDGRLDLEAALALLSDAAEREEARP